MKRLRLLILFSVAILAIGITTYLASAREGHPGHASGSPALDGSLSNATASFGGGKLLFWSRRGGQAQIWTMNADGSNERQITCNNDGEVVAATWSPDGQSIIFYSGFPNNIQKLYLIGAADGTEQTRLTNYPGADVFPNWSPDGQKIVFHRQVFDLEHPGGINQLFIMNADGSDQTQITFPPTTNAFPAWGHGHVR